MDRSKPGHRLISLADLSTDLLSDIFSRLGPTPQDLVPISLVCREWDAIMRCSTWKALCMRFAPTLCTALSYGDLDTSVPPGGWASLYKLLLYCPGLHPALTDQLEESRTSLDKADLQKIGHLRTGCPTEGFWTGPDALRALRFRAPFCKDQVFLSSACEQDSLSRSPCRKVLAQKTWEHGCRGIVKDFPRSAIYAELFPGGDPPLKNGEDKGRPCPYCNSATFQLDEGLFFERQDMLRVNRGVVIEGGFELFAIHPSHYRGRRTPLCAPLYRKAGLQTRLSQDEKERGLTKECIEDITVPGDLVDFPTRTIGRVCSQGHLMLACIGARKDRIGSCIPCSEDSFELEPCGLVFFLAKHGGKTIQDVSEALRFKALLSRGDLSEMKRRLEELAYSWPSETWDRPKTDFAGVLEFLGNRRAFRGLTGPGTRECLMSYVRTGSPGLHECIKGVAFEALSAFPAPTN